MIVQAKDPISLEPSYRTVGVTIYWANWSQNTAGRNTKTVNLTTILFLTNIPKHGISVPVATVSTSWNVCTVLQFNVESVLITLPCRVTHITWLCIHVIIAICTNNKREKRHQLQACNYYLSVIFLCCVRSNRIVIQSTVLWRMSR